MTHEELEREKLELERERWRAESAFREREVAVAESEEARRGAELELKRQEQARAGWRNPLVVVILAATVAAVGNAAVTIVNGILQRDIEDQKSEQTRILEMIKTGGDPDKAAENLEFLLEAGLIDDPERIKKLKAFLAAREPGSGPTLRGGPVFGGIVDWDDAVFVDSLPANSRIRASAGAVGQLRILSELGQQSCTAFLVADDLALTAHFCIDEATSAELVMRDTEGAKSYAVVLPPAEVVADDYGLNFSLLRVSGNPGRRHGNLSLRAVTPVEDEALAVVYFRGAGRKLAVMSADCRVIRVEEVVFHHLCDTGAGSAGAPILRRDGRSVLGMHFRRGAFGGVAVRTDAILRVSQSLASNR